MGQEEAEIKDQSGLIKEPETSAGSQILPETPPLSETPVETRAASKTLFGIIPLGNLQLSRIVAPVIIGLLAVAAIVLFARTRSQSRQLTDEVAVRQSLEGQVSNLETQLSSQLRETNELANGLKTVRTERDQFQSEATTLKSSQVQLQKELESSVAFAKTLEERLTAEKETIAELQTASKEYQESQKRLYEKLESLLDEKKTLQDQLFQANSGTSADAVDMPGLIVKDSRSSIPSLSGTILKVNQQYDFVVFNRGESDGVKQGDLFRVMDRNKEIGEVVATRVLPDMTIADIDRRQTHRGLKKGFSVFLNE